MNPATSISNPVDNLGPPLQGVAVALLTLALMSFSLRVYVRTRIIKAFGTDDWLMLGATVAFVLYSACVLAGVHYGTGRHYWDLAASDVRQALEVGEKIIHKGGSTKANNRVAAVLVLLLYWLLLDHDPLQALHRSLSATHCH